MGLFLDKLKQFELGGGYPNPNSQNGEKSTKSTNQSKKKYVVTVKFPDLESIPPELSLQILKYLNATDLCLAACVWSSLANDDVLWQSLCKTTWGYASIYNSKTITKKSTANLKNYRSIFMHLDEATLTFNADWRKV
jgi:hypothetical protein